MLILLRRRTLQVLEDGQRYLSLFTNRIDKSLSVGPQSCGFDPAKRRSRLGTRRGSLSCRNPREKGHCILQLVVHELMHEEDIARRHLSSAAGGAGYARCTLSFALLANLLRDCISFAIGDSVSNARKIHSRNSSAEIARSPVSTWIAQLDGTVASPIWR